MIIKRTFIADDGEEFESEEACIEYEEAMNPEGGVIFYDGNMKRVTKENGPASMLDHAMYLYISNAKKAQKFFDWIVQYYGMAVPIELTDGAMFVYDDRAQGYCNLNDKIRALIDIQDEIFKDLRTNGGWCWEVEENLRKEANLARMARKAEQWDEQCRASN